MLLHVRAIHVWTAYEPQNICVTISWYLIVNSSQWNLSGVGYDLERTFWTFHFISGFDINTAATW